MSVDTTPDIASDLNLGPMVTDSATTGKIIRHTDDRWNLLLALDHFKNSYQSSVSQVREYILGSHICAKSLFTKQLYLSTSEKILNQPRQPRQPGAPVN